MFPKILLRGSHTAFAAARAVGRLSRTLKEVSGSRLASARRMNNEVKLVLQRHSRHFVSSLFVLTRPCRTFFDRISAFPSARCFESVSKLTQK